MTEYISIDDVMSVFDDYMRGDVNEDDRDTFLEMLTDKSEDVLDRIKAAIFNACSDNHHMPVYKLNCNEIFVIIDNCMAESEDKDVT